MKDCNGHEGYSVDEFGNVYSHRRKVGRGRGNGHGTKVIIDKSYCKKLKPAIGQSGYPLVYLSPDNRAYHIHRLVAETFIPNPENKPCVNHIDFNITNSYVDNLEWVTYPENNLHSARHGRIGGEKCNFTKLSERDVLEIRKLAETTMHRKDIAEKYGIIPDYVRLIQRRLVWKYI